MDTRFVVLGWCGEYADHRYWVQSAPVGHRAMKATMEALSAACSKAVEPSGTCNEIAQGFRDVDPQMSARVLAGSLEFPIGYDVWRIDPETNVPQLLEFSSITYDIEPIW